MSFTDQLLAALVAYGVPLLFVAVAVAAIGVPLPASIMLIAAGSFTQQGEFQLLPVMLAASGAAIIGDQISYGLSRWGGRRIAHRVTRKIGTEKQLQQAEQWSRKWGAAGIFFSRWLFTGLGPWINISSGITQYPWGRFTLWAVVGELLWVALCVLLGYFFSDRVQYIAQILGNLAWAILAFIVAIILGWKLFRFYRPAASAAE